MKRDIDLSRQLLLDLEGHGHHCSLSALQSGVAPEVGDRIRYHLRLLIDAGLVKEVDRTSAGVPCVRLTHTGQELVELSRCDAQWQEAKIRVQETTGGLSLTVLRAVLTRWAVSAADAPPIRRRRLSRPTYHRVETERPRRRYGLDRDFILGESQGGLAPLREDYRESLDWRDTCERDYFYRRDEEIERFAAIEDEAVSVSLPIYMV